MLKAKRKVIISNLGEIAQHFGVSTSHISRIINGQRRSPRIEKGLEALNIKCKKYRRARRESNQ